MKISIAFLLALMLVSVQFGCEYDEVLPPAPPDEVSFSGDILPIFNQSCNAAGCHSGTGDFAPDLSPANAYHALFDGNYIDTLRPDESPLYLWMTGEAGLVMPPDGTNPFYNATVLKWIELGAPEN